MALDFENSKHTARSVMCYRRDDLVMKFEEDKLRWGK